MEARPAVPGFPAEQDASRSDLDGDRSARAGDAAPAPGTGRRGIDLKPAPCVLGGDGEDPSRLGGVAPHGEGDVASERHAGAGRPRSAAIGRKAAMTLRM